MKWINCSNCEEEFRVISESIEPVIYCPMCGSYIEDDQEEDQDNYED